MISVQRSVFNYTDCSWHSGCPGIWHALGHRQIQKKWNIQKLRTVRVCWHWCQLALTKCLNSLKFAELLCANIAEHATKDTHFRINVSIFFVASFPPENKPRSQRKRKSFCFLFALAFLTSTPNCDDYCVLCPATSYFFSSFDWHISYNCLALCWFSMAVKLMDCCATFDTTHNCNSPCCCSCHGGNSSRISVEILKQACIMPVTSAASPLDPVTHVSAELTFTTFLGIFRRHFYGYHIRIALKRNVCRIWGINVSIQIKKSL